VCCGRSLVLPKTRIPIAPWLGGGDVRTEVDVERDFASIKYLFEGTQCNVGFANVGGNAGFISLTVGDNQTHILYLFCEVEEGFVVE
jgi:hypothetical protein